MKRIDELSYLIFTRLIDGSTDIKREYYRDLDYIDPDNPNHIYVTRNLERGDLGHKDVALSSGPLGEGYKSLISDKLKKRG